MLSTQVTRILLLLGLMLSVGILPTSAVPIVSITPSSVVIQPEQNFSLDISITDALDLYAFQFDLSFDPAILSAGSIMEGAFLPTGGATFFIDGAIDNTAGTIALTADTLQTALAGVNGNGILATVGFQALRAGTSVVTLSNVILLDSALGDMTATIADGSVTVRQPVTGVPEPSACLLVATGCIGLLAYGWRHRQRMA